MIRFQTFSTLELEDTDGAELRAVLSQPKRLALLAYLAAAPRRFHRRDTLLAVFWPELDARRARGALNAAVYKLRRALGAGVLVTRGDEEIGLDPAQIRCDVMEFEAALDEGRLDAALALYRGDFLHGFFLSGTPEWDHWLEQERDRLRERARSGAWTLAERSEAAGDIQGATRWARHTLEITPEDERALRLLISLLDRSGERAGALRVYQDFARRLAEEYGATPSPETRALIEAVRGREAVRSDAGAAAATVEPNGSASDEPDIVPPSRPRWAVLGSGRARVAAAAVVALALATVWVDSHGHDSNTAALADHVRAPASIAVLPFTVHGDSTVAYLGDGMVDLLSDKLSGGDGPRTVDPRALLSYLGRASGGTAVEHGRTVARHFGAAYVVLGGIATVGAELELDASLYQEPGGSIVARAAATGSADRLPALVDDLARQLLIQLPHRTAETMVRPAANMTTSLPALKAYLAGEHSLRAGRYQEAADAFQRAVRADTAFALAYFGWHHAAIWTGQADAASRAGKNALRYADRLSEADRLVLRAWQRSTYAPIEAETLYRQALQRHPDDIDAWYQLGDLLYHWGPLVGRPAAAARAPFERVLFFEPEDVGALMHLVRIAGMEGRTAALDTLSALILARDPDEAQALEISALRAFALGDQGAQDMVVQQARYADGTQLRFLVWSVAVNTGQLEDAAQLARAFLTPARTADWHVFHLQAAELEAARGRWGAATRELDSLAMLVPARAAEYRAMLATLPFLAVPESELRRIRRDFPRPDGAVTVGAWLDYLQANRIYAPRALYLLGLLSVRLHDLPAAGRYAGELEHFTAGDQRAAAFAAEFARSVRAEIARQSGDPQRALSLLGAPSVPPDSLLPTLVSYPKAQKRWLRAELLHQLGRDREALEWYATFPSPEGYDIVYAAAAELRQGGIRERLGEHADAARHYARALAYWDHAGPALAPLVTEARTGLARTR